MTDDRSDDGRVGGRHVPVLLDRVVALAGWERPWDHDRVQDLPADVLERIDREMGRR